MGPVPPAQNPQWLSKPLLPTYAYKNSSKIGNQIMTRVSFWLPELLSGLLKLGSGCAFLLPKERNKRIQPHQRGLLDSQQNWLVSEGFRVLPREDKSWQFTFLKTHASHIGKQLSVFLSCSLTVFKLVREEKWGIHFLTVFWGRGGFVSFFESFQL